MNDIFIYHHYIMSKIFYEADDYDIKETSDMADKCIRDWILTPNELRQIVGLEKMEELM